MCLSNSDGTPVYTIINLNRSYRPCRRKLANEHNQCKFSLYPSFELVPFVVRTKTNCEREKIIMIRRLNLNKRRNKICTFIHLLCLMNIKKQTSLGKYKSNLNQTPMPLLFCDHPAWSAYEFKSSLIVILKPSCWQLLLSGSNTNAQTCEVNFVAKWVLK